MSEFKPGDRVKHSRWGELTLTEPDELRWRADGPGGGKYSGLRPSELTPADPVPDDATLLVRELCAKECDGFGKTSEANMHRNGLYDTCITETAFAKYIRANQLTVERVREALDKVVPLFFAGSQIERLHAAITERKA